MRIHKNFYIAVLFLVVSFLCMLFLTTASPLYSVNPSPDGNTMFTVGKGLLHGLMPYKDLFDQRGPLIYLMNSVAALISYKSFFGIYIFESVAMFLDLFFVFKILNIKYSKKISIVSTFTIIPFIFASKFFSYGNLPEEYILPLIFITIYMFTHKQVNDWGKYEYIVIGFFISISFWIKYTLSITWIAIYLVLIIYFIYNKFCKKLFMSISYGIIGFLPVTLLIIILYTFKHALYDLFYVYFYLNMTLYVNHGLILPVKFLIVLILFLFIYIKFYNLSTLSKYTLITITLFNYLIMFKIGFSIYYFEIITFMFIFIPLVLGSILDKHRILYKIIYIIPLLTIFAIFVINYNFVKYSQFTHKSKTQPYNNVAGPVIREFASIVDKSNNRTVLNYKRLDLGIYTYSGVLPNDKYFDSNNMKYVPMNNSQKRSLESKKDNFIFIAYGNYPTEIFDYKLSKHERDILRYDYKIIDSKNGIIEGKKGKYVLYQRKN